VACERFFHDKSQKCAQPLSLGERAAADDPIEMLSDDGVRRRRTGHGDVL
jgi:hypothetical protein